LAIRRHRQGISDLLVKYLVKDGSYSVIERKAMDKILTEQISPTAIAPTRLRRQNRQMLAVDASSWQHHAVRQ